MRSIFSVFLMLVSLAIAASGQDLSTNAVQNPQASGFRLWPGDVIEIKFFYNPELNDTIQIRPDGKISLPLIGDVDVSNRPIDEVRQNLQTLYVPHLKTPELSINVKTYGSQKVYVGGEVLRPGMISLIGQLNISEAILEAGGMTKKGRADQVVVIRKNENGLPVMRLVSLKMVMNQPAPEAGLSLLPFDVVMVPESKTARVNRWVDENIRQMLPVVLTSGFSYLINGGIIH
jgi:protein involved in polysaccharide export with SLBB domain